MPTPVGKTSPCSRQDFPDEWFGDVPPGVMLASARGAHAAPVSEWVLSAILCLYRQWPALVRYQDSETWAHRRVDADTLNGK
ncbi:MAG: hypothetical protein ACRDSE_04895 [Pseudonocardiaceae bacterium]